ncbi:non-homologous end-joining DNA ligase LigD [Xanthomonas graminis]|uniref:DNA ligase D polymerase domain-containing protein n=1 Tax=Xanthomonas graminis pv. poae TaxID=227946 RepID=A0A199NXU3_9XANT|nr:hypothetical protein [Xanthomonas translucens]OAX53824.1 hypothetical protein A6R73_05870 [Xanthomonas translucens pv. poae]
MARPIWTGTLSFGLLNVPVALMSGERRVDLHFRMVEDDADTPQREDAANNVVDFMSLLQKSLDAKRRTRLRETGLESFVRLSGGKGLHVVVPIVPDADWAQARDFCEAFAQALTASAPERYVATISKAKRSGVIFVDWLRNGRGNTSVCSWSLRARARHRGGAAALGGTGADRLAAGVPAGQGAAARRAPARASVEGDGDARAAVAWELSRRAAGLRLPFVAFSRTCWRTASRLKSLLHWIQALAAQHTQRLVGAASAATNGAWIQPWASTSTHERSHRSAASSECARAAIHGAATRAMLA